jgi:hypothetical protein
MTRCSICGTILHAHDDPMSADCGGDCWGCVGPMEKGNATSEAVVRAEIRAGLRDADGRALRDVPMDDATFYGACAAILGTTYDCTPFTGRVRTRWNNRRPGGGRFPEFGLIRLFGDHVHVAIHAPFRLNLAVRGRRTALSAIARAQANHVLGEA